MRSKHDEIGLAKARRKRRNRLARRLWAEGLRFPWAEVVGVDCESGILTTQAVDPDGWFERMKAADAPWGRPNPPMARPKV